MSDFKRTKTISHVKFGQHIFDSKCKNAIKDLDVRIQRALREAIAKTKDTISLMGRTQAPKSIFDECSEVVAKLADSLTTLPISSLAQPTKGPTISPFKLTSRPHELQLQLSTLERLQAVKTKNTHQCLQAYRSLLRQGPLLTHLQALPESVQLLLDASPENCQKNLYKRIIQGIPKEARGTELALLASLVLSSYFLALLGQVYVDMEKSLNFFFKTHLPKLKKLGDHNEQDNPPRQTRQRLGTFATKGTTSRKTVQKKPKRVKTTQVDASVAPSTKTGLVPSIVKRSEPQLNIVPQGQPDQPIAIPAFNLIPVEQDRTTAIEAQISARHTHELTARAQLKQWPLGALARWSGSHLDRKTQLLKLVNFENARNTLVFMDEATGEFIKHGLDDLVQAVLNGDLKRTPPPRKIRHNLISFRRP